MTPPFDDIVVGAGILGLAVASRLHARGRSVLVLERHPRARGASIRNFGMIWPIGQPPGEQLDTALESRELWLRTLQTAQLWHHRGGSLHLAHHDDEAEVLHQFAAEAEHRGLRVHLLSPEQARERCPRIRTENLRAALFSETEINVDARTVIPGLTRWLEEDGVVFRFGRTVTQVTDGRVRTGEGDLHATRVWICSGDILHGLCARQLQHVNLSRCKLQMLAASPLPERSHPGCMIAAGLTLAHYAAFHDLPGLPELRRGLDSRFPFARKHGIHVMLSGTSNGELVIGDSHHYDDDIDPFDRTDIDDEILRILDSFFDRRETRITRRWHGTYLRCTTAPWVILDPDAHTTLLTGVGGAGMTLSFGLAERVVDQRT